MLNRNSPGQGAAFAARNGPAGGEDVAGNAAPAAAGVVREVALQLEWCRQRAARVHGAEARVAASVEWMLAGVYDLRRLMASDPAAASRSVRLLPFAESPVDEITRLFLLFFPGRTLKPATLRRYVGTVWLAEREGITPRDFVRFVRRNGGVSGCGDRAVRQMPR